MTKPWVQLASGRSFDLLEPTVEQATGILPDLIHSICRINRFNGHTKGPFVWSVGSHSLLVADLLEEWGATPLICRAGLLHDIGEAIYGDVTSPVIRAMRTIFDERGRWRHRGLTMRACGVCGLAQYETTAGWTCAGGHGGAAPVERPTDPSGEVAQRLGYLAQLEAHVRAGGQLSPEIVFWLIEQAKGGFWGRMAAHAMQDARTHRNALRIIVKALVENTGLGWTARHWRPILTLLAPRITDHDSIGPLPAATARLDVGLTISVPDPSQPDHVPGLRLVEAGELGPP